MIKRIIPIFLVVLMLTQFVAFAANPENIDELIEARMTDLVDMDRVFKYDYVTSTAGPETQEEVLKYHNAMHAVVTLGIMDLLKDGLYGENEAVTFKEFANIIMELYTTPVSQLQELYELYPDNRFTTQNEAAYYLVGVTGYDVYEKKYQNDPHRARIAQEIGLLKGIDFKGEKNITRGELAKMILNAIQKDMVVQTAFGGTEQFDIIPGETIIKKQYNAAIIQGTVTAQHGMNLYSEAPLEKGVISIDRVAYDASNRSFDDVLGYQVQAVVQLQDSETRSSNKKGNIILGLTIDENNQSFSVPINGDCYATDTDFYYTTDGREQRVSLGSFERILLNDSVISAGEFGDYLQDAHGEVRLVSTEKSGDYTIAFIRNWSSFTVQRVSMTAGRLYFDYGATLNSQGSIDISTNKNIYVLKDGRGTGIGSVTAGSVIDVVESKSRRDVLISISDAAVSGTITQMNENSVLIKEERYFISPAYTAAMELGYLIPLEVGLSGSFQLNSMGEIVGFIGDISRYKIGVMTKVGQISQGLRDEAIIRVLQQDNTWNNLPLAPKLTFDGRDGVERKDAATIMQNNLNKVCYAPIRYELNQNGEVRFLDTAIVNPEELSDPDTIQKEDTITETMNWTIAGGAAGSLGNTSYFINSSHIYIELPKNREREAGYRISNKHSLASDQQYTLVLYNADDFNGVSIIVKDAGNIVAKNDGSTNTVFLVSKVLAVDEYGDIINFVELYTTSRGMVRGTSSEPEIQAVINEADVGDVLQVDFDGSDILSMKIWCPVEEIMTKDILDDATTYAQYEIGTVTMVDAARGMVKVKIGETEKTWKLRNNAVNIFHLSKPGGGTMAIGDIVPGDRIVGNGIYNSMTGTIVRQ